MIKNVLKAMSQHKQGVEGGRDGKGQRFTKPYVKDTSSAGSEGCQKIHLRLKLNTVRNASWYAKGLRTVEHLGQMTGSYWTWAIVFNGV